MNRGAASAVPHNNGDAMKVEIINRVGVRGKTALPGDVLDVSSDEARSLIAWGDAIAYAEPGAAPEPWPASEPAPEPEEPKRRRGRPRKRKAKDAGDAED